MNLNIGSQVNLNLPALDNAAAQIGAVTDALAGLRGALRDLGQNSYSLVSGINSMFTSISRSAAQAATDIGRVSGALGGVSGGGGGGGAPSAPGGGGAPGWVSSATASAGAAQGAATGFAAGGALPGGGVALPAGMPIAGALGTQGAPMEPESFARMAAMTPLRFMRDRIQGNRATALSTAGTMSLTAFAQQGQGVTSQSIMSTLARRPGDIQGSVQDYLSLMNMAPGAGAMYGFNGGGNAPRTAGFLESVRQAQYMSPMMPVQEIGQMIGGFAGNVQAQQQSQFMTGGAFSMVKPGGGQKSLQQWADSILKWFRDLRAGDKRGEDFSYGELMAQYFPGSNIDAWFQMNGVPPDLREFWWSYALGRASHTGSDRDRFTIAPEGANVAWQRLQAATATTKTEFGLAGTMAGAYANREQSNRWFNEVMGSLVQQVIPAAVSKGPLSFMQFLPDTIEDLLMTFLERTGGVGTLAAGALSYGGIGVGNLSDMFESLFEGAGDVGDVGDYGPLGGTSLAGLQPDVRQKVGRMLQANPRLRVTSGLRDRSTQQRLAAQGVGKVSGRPSAHTRGQAVDLGPPSQYKWLIKNTSKFGLRSGADVGEPWHVGIGDPPDRDPSTGHPNVPGRNPGTDPGGGADVPTIPGRNPNVDAPFAEDYGAIDIIGAFQDLIGAAFGASDEEFAKMPGTIGNIIDRLAGFLTAALGGKAKGGKYPTDLGRLAFQPNLMTQFPTSFTSGGIVSGPRGGTTGGTGGEGVSPGTPVSGDDLTRATTVARYASSLGGWSGDDLATMIAIAGAESTWTPDAHRSDKDKALMSGDRGLFQINYTWDDDLAAAGIISSATTAGKRELFDPAVNTRAARFVYDRQGLDAWSVYNSGAYQAHIDTAHQAMTSAGVGDIESYYPMISGGTTRTAPVIFYNTFNVGSGGGGNQVDLRRSVMQMADHLEIEMKKRASRAS